MLAPLAAVAASSLASWHHHRNTGQCRTGAATASADGSGHVLQPSPSMAGCSSGMCVASGYHCVVPVAPGAVALAGVPTVVKLTAAAELAPHVSFGIVARSAGKGQVEP